jgi:hypothetical protein
MAVIKMIIRHLNMIRHTYIYTEGIDCIYTLIFMAIPVMAYYGDYTRA